MNNYIYGSDLLCYTVTEVHLLLEAKIKKKHKDLTVIQLMHKSEAEPAGLNLRSFSCTDWSWSLTDDHRYFVIGYSDTYVMSDCCIVDHIIMEHSSPDNMNESLMSMLNRHTPDEFAKRLYAYCKSTLKADSNTTASENVKTTYSLSMFGPNQNTKTWLYYRPVTRDWTAQYIDKGVYKTDDISKFIAFINTLDMSMIDIDLYVSKFKASGAGTIEHIMLKDLFKTFFKVPKFY